MEFLCRNTQAMGEGWETAIPQTWKANQIPTLGYRADRKRIGGFTMSLASDNSDESFKNLIGQVFDNGSTDSGSPKNSAEKSDEEINQLLSLAANGDVIGIASQKKIHSHESKNMAHEILERVGPAALIPIPKRQKGPRISGWQNIKHTSMTDEYLSQFHADINIGVVLGRASDGLISIDADTDDGLLEFQSLNPLLSASHTTKGVRGGNIWFRVIDTYPSSCKITTNCGEAWGELRADRMQTVIHGEHPTGVKYSWNGNPPQSVKFSEIKFPTSLNLPWLKEKHSQTNHSAPSSNISSESLIDRARSYIAKMPPAIAGHGGDATTFNVAKKLVHDFGLSISDALPLMQEYNEQCVPSWSEKDLFRKLTDATNLTRTSAPKGALASELFPSARPLAGEQKEAIEKKKAELFDAFQCSTLPSTKLKNLQIPPRQKIVGDWFRESDLGFIFARRGLGKTWFSLGLATSIANNTNFGPWKTHCQLPVLYIDGEMPLESIEQRIAGLGASDDLHVLNHEGLFHQSGQTFNLADPIAQESITKLCLENGIKVLVMDNLSCLFNGIKENDNDAWEMVLPWLLSMRRHRISVLIVAHSGRDGKNMRGASRREDAAFFVIRLEDSADHGSDPQDGARFVSRFTKNRNSPSEEVPVQWEFRSFEDGQIYITHKEADGLSVLLDWVRSGLTSASDIGDEMGLSKGQVSKMAKKAIDMGVLVKNGRSYAIA
jgi:hypothetical protein